ncbi:MAG: condensation domain-containing protein [Beijerinckiaceae bacterium]
MNEFVPEPTSRQVWCMRLCRSLKSDDMRRRFWTLANAATLMPALDGERLAEAWRATLEANPALRCTFTEDGDAIIAQVLPLDHFPVKQIDTEGWSADEVIASVNATTADYAPLDGPLAMLTHYRSSTSSTLLALFHHGLIDGTAMTLLIRELIGAYLLGRPPNARATGNFAEFAAWQRDFLAGPAGARQFDYWMGQLADLPPPLPLPYDRPDNHRFTDGRYLSCAVAPSVAEGVRVLARSLGVPPFRPLWAAFNISIAAMTGVDDAPIVCSVANRTNRRFRETIGWLANAVHLRCAIESGERVRAYCARVSRMVDAAIDNQEYPRNLVDDALEAQFPGIPTAIDQLGFSVNMPLWDDESGLNRLLAQPSGSWGGFSFEMMPLELRECTRDLTMTVLDVVAPDGEMTLSLYINYRADVFDQATAERLAALYERALELVTSADDPLVEDVVVVLRAEFVDLRGDAPGRRNVR